MNDPLIRRLIELDTHSLLMSCPTTDGLLFGSIQPRPLPVDRGQRFARRQVHLVQTRESYRERWAVAARQPRRITAPRPATYGQVLRTRCGTIGRVRIRLPVPANTALPMAAPIVPMAGSPAPRAG